jgi:hypothetical protein
MHPRTGLVWYFTVSRPNPHKLLDPYSFLSILLSLIPLFVISISDMDPRREKRSKKGQDVARPSSKQGHQGKAVVIRSPPPHPRHHPSHSSEEDDDDCELSKIHSPIKCTNRMPHKYSRKTKQEIINQNHGHPVYDYDHQSSDLRLWSHFHMDWYNSAYRYAKKLVVETKWVNWEWMATRRHTIFNQIKAASDVLEMTKTMSFKYDWNNEIMCQFYATLYFDIDGQKLLWMTDEQRYEIIVQWFACLLGLNQQLTMESDNRIHTYNVVKPDEMLFMYAPGAKATPPKIQNFHPKLNTLHHLLCDTLAPRIGDATACLQYERTLILFYVQKKPFSVFDFILQEILNISRNTLRNYGYAPHIMMMIERRSQALTSSRTFRSPISNLSFQCSSYHHGCSFHFSCSTLHTFRQGSTSTCYLLLRRYVEGAQEHVHLVLGHAPASACAPRKPTPPK